MKMPIVAFLFVVFPLTVLDAHAGTPTVIIQKGENIDFLLEIAGKRWNTTPDSQLPLHVQRYARAWLPYERPVLEALEEATGLRFATPTIEAYLLRLSGKPMSRPVMIPFDGISNESHFVGILTHELTHRLFSDNNADESDAFLRERFPGEDIIMARHVMVFALMTHIFTNVVRDTQVLEVTRRGDYNGARGPYTQAWEKVQESDYQELLRAFRTRAKKLPR